MGEIYKNIKIGEKHHELLKNHCDNKGLKMYKLIEKWIDENCKPKKNGGDLYGD